MSDDLQTYEPTRNPDQPVSGSSDEAGNGPELSEIRERAERLRNRGSGIIQRALSGNSERFLEHSRQQGGQ